MAERERWQEVRQQLLEAYAAGPTREELSRVARRHGVTPALRGARTFHQPGVGASGLTPTPIGHDTPVEWSGH